MGIPGKRPAIVQADNVVGGVFVGTSDGIPEPIWPTTGPWGKRAAQIASERWHELIGHMQRLRTLGPENAVAVEIASMHYATWKLASDAVAERGPILHSEGGGLYRNPYLEVANGAAERMLKIEDSMGIAPAMRGRVMKVTTARKADVGAQKFLTSKSG